MTRDEFGTTLYETIVTIGGILGLHQQIAGAVHYRESRGVEALKVRREALRKDLAALMPQLTPDETRQVVARYPMVTTL